jgi:hypothetical protein
MTPERLKEIRYNVAASPAYRVPNEVVVELLAEFDAVREERDTARNDRAALLLLDDLRREQLATARQQ